MPTHSYILKYFDHHPEERTIGVKIENPPTERRPSVFNIETLLIPVDNLKIPIRIYTPEENDYYSLLVFFHGDGFMSGDFENADIPSRMISSFSGHKIISVNYPTFNKIQAQKTFDICYKVTNWIFDHANQFKSSSQDIGVCGASIGATISTIITMQAIKNGNFMPSNQILFYPIVDFNEDVEKSEYLSRKMYNNKYGVEISSHLKYLQNVIGMSPILFDKQILSKMPNTLLFTAEYDPYCDEGELYAEKLKEAGAYCKLIRFDGNIHGFMQNFPGSPDYMRGYESVAEFLIQEEREVLI